MISIFNPNKLTRQPFFQSLINFLYQTDDVSLRSLKKQFSEVSKIERLLEDYVQAGYIIRKNKRYSIGVELIDKVDDVGLNSHVFIDNQSPEYFKLMAKVFETTLYNETNGVVLIEKTGISRNELTLSNYFFKLKNRLQMSEKQAPLFELLGDVNSQYALKYLTTFLLKFENKNTVSKRRPDIFVEALETLDYIRKDSQGNYQLNMFFDKKTLTFRAKK